MVPWPRASRPSLPRSSATSAACCFDARRTWIMANTIELKVPDIGGHENVPVIEVMVKAGDSVTKEQSLITLESDKATMEIPASASGVIKEMKLKVGDEVSEGAVIAILEVAGAEAEAPKAAAPAPAPAAAPAKSAASPAPQAAGATGRTADIECKLVVL